MFDSGSHRDQSLDDTTDASVESPLLRGFVALRYRNFRLYWFGQLISLVGTWMQSVGQVWLVLQLTNSPFLLGLVVSLQFAPVLIFGLFGGVVADKVPKRTLLVSTQATSMVLAFVLAVLTSLNIVTYWHVLVLATLLGVVMSFDMPARQAFVAEIVEPEHLMNAIALNSTIFNAARVAGPAVAGILIARLGLASLFYLNGASFVAVIAGLLLMRVKPIRHAPKVSGVFESVREGLSYVRRTRAALTIIILIAVVSTFGMNFSVLVPLFAQNVLHVGATGFGFLMACMGLGSLLASLALAYSGRRSSPVILGGALIFALLELGFAFSPTYALSLVLITSMGWSMVAFTTTANTTLQLLAPDHLRGRVMSVYTTVFVGSTPVGSLLIGWLADVLGAPLAMALGALLSLAAVVWALVVGVPESLPESGGVNRPKDRAA